MLDFNEAYKRIERYAGDRGYNIALKRDLPGVRPSAVYANATAITIGTIPGGYATLFLLTQDGPVIDVWNANREIARKHALSLRRRRLITADQYESVKGFYAYSFAFLCTKG